MLDCCHPLPKVREEGITLTQASWSLTVFVSTPGSRSQGCKLLAPWENGPSRHKTTRLWHQPAGHGRCRSHTFHTNPAPAFPPRPAPQAACLARCNGARVELYPYGSVTVEEFRAMVADACATAEQHIIVSYSRKEFSQTGGHRRVVLQAGRPRAWPPHLRLA